MERGALSSAAEANEYFDSSDLEREFAADMGTGASPAAIAVKYSGRSYGCRGGETVLDALIRQGADITFSCRKGVCHGCLQRATGGAVPDAARRGLKPDLAARGYFLPCLCHPSEDLTLAPPDRNDLSLSALVVASEQVAPAVHRILLEPFQTLEYAAGQFINVRHPDGALRSYSLASCAEESPYLELHVERIAGGAVSDWLTGAVGPDDEITVFGPFGSCVYAARDSAQSLLLVATGTGLAPMLGIARAALEAGHSGEIALYHGSSTADGLYLGDELAALAARHGNFRYVRCVSGAGARGGDGVRAGRAQALAFTETGVGPQWQVYAAGNPAAVEAVRAAARAAGVAEAAIFTDAFVPSDAAAPAPAEPRDFAPDPEIWAMLGEGRLLNAVLTDFYTRVFDDPVLSPYFQGVTRQRLIEKVYSFMRQVFTGEKCYFGNRPRNAHNWMIVTDEVFDYRERLMTECMRRQGLCEAAIVRWTAIEESFRGDIVKSEPLARTIDGVEIPVSGFGRTVLEVGAVCDACEAILDPGEEVLYHLRTGEMYCPDCGNDK